MATAITKMAETYDMISHRLFGSGAYTADIIAMNFRYRLVSRFPAGVTVQVPDVVTKKSNVNLPPWKQQ